MTDQPEAFPAEEVAPLVKQLAQTQKASKDVVAALKEVQKLERADPEYDEPLRWLRAVEKVQATSVRAQALPSHYAELHAWATATADRLRSLVDRQRSHFGAQLETALGEVDLALGGQYPDFKVGPFSMEANADTGKLRIWWGPKQEVLGECALSPAVIVETLVGFRRTLGSGLPEGDLLARLRTAHRRLASDDLSPVRLVDLLPEIALLVQENRYRVDPRKENYRGYGRADFSADLLRLQRHVRENDRSVRIVLKAATRSETRKRSDYLWVPTDESGRGSVYAHLALQGV